MGLIYQGTAWLKTTAWLKKINYLQLSMSWHDLTLTVPQHEEVTVIYKDYCWVKELVCCIWIIPQAVVYARLQFVPTHTRSINVRTALFLSSTPLGQSHSRKAAEQSIRSVPQTRHCANKNTSRNDGALVSVWVAAAVTWGRNECTDIWEDKVLDELIRGDLDSQKSLNLLWREKEQDIWRKLQL